MNIEAELTQMSTWAIDQLRTIKLNRPASAVLAYSKSIRTTVYQYSDGLMKDLSLRFCRGAEQGVIFDEMVWLGGQTESGLELRIGVEPSYVYFRTKALITNQILEHISPDCLPLQDFLMSAIYELEALLKFSTTGLMRDFKLVPVPENSFMVLTHHQQLGLVLTGEQAALTELEKKAQQYCVGYWRRQDSLGRQILYKVLVYLMPTRRYWHPLDIQNIEIGDVIAMQSKRESDQKCSVKSEIHIPRRDSLGYTMRASMEINDDGIELTVTDEEMSMEYSKLNAASGISPDEHIELEVFAGQTRVPFNDLCNVTSGALIELNQHMLPMVILRVNGIDIFEGELVRFQDQLMVQVTKRIE